MLLEYEIELLFLLNYSPFMKLIKLLVFTLMLYGPQAMSVTVLNIWQGNWSDSGLYLIRALLDETKQEYGEYELRKVDWLEQARAQKELIAGRHISLLMFATSAEREQLMWPIRVPLTNGTASYRICLINKGQQARFNDIYDLNDWMSHNLIIGQGNKWPDVEILRANGLEVVTASRTHSLAEMMKRGRFDCATRALFEVEGFPQYGITIEQKLLFHYPMPSFLFVNKSNTDLYNRLSLGFERIKRNGKFAGYIDKFYQQPIGQLSLHNRRVIYLDNPLLTEETRAALLKTERLFSLKNGN